MQANRYDQAAEAPIMNTYVPINFNELYRIGQAQREAVEQASRELSGQVQKFGEFQSPSQVDTERWYSNTIGQLSDVIQEAASNPDALKDAGFRSRFQSKINNLDYSTLSSLKQSREGMLQRQKANQELMMRGLYNPEWHDVDFTNYDTSRAGTFNDVSPLAYKSEVDLVKPFVDNLKASFMGTKNGWIRHGVSTDRTDYEIMDNLSSIQNTPEYAKHVEVLQRRGLSRQEAENEINKTLITAGREFAYEQAERDPWWIESMKQQRRAAAGAQDSRRLLNLTEQVHLDGKRTMYENFTSLTPQEMDAVTIQGLGVLPKDKQQRVLDELNPGRIQEVLRGSFESVLEHTGSKNTAVSNVLDRLSSPLDPHFAMKIYGRYNTTDTPDGRGNYRAKDSRNFILQDELAFGILGEPNQYGMQTARNYIFSDMWKNGEFHDFIIAPESKVVTDGGRMYHRKYAYVPLEQFDNAKFLPDEGDKKRKKKGLTREDELRQAVEEAGFDITTLDDSDNEQSITVRLDNRDNVDSKSVNTKIKKVYVRVPVATVIPSEGQAAVAADFEYNDKRGFRNETNETQNVYSESVRFPYSNLDDDQ